MASIRDHMKPRTNILKHYAQILCGLNPTKIILEKFLASFFGAANWPILPLKNLEICIGTLFEISGSIICYWSELWEFCDFFNW